MGTLPFIQAVHLDPACPNARLVNVVALQEDVGEVQVTPDTVTTLLLPLTWKFIDLREVKWNLVDNQQKGPGPHWVRVAPMSTVGRVDCLWWNCPKESFHPTSGNSALGGASHPGTFPERRTFLFTMKRLSLICCFPVQL